MILLALLTLIDKHCTKIYFKLRLLKILYLREFGLCKSTNGMKDNALVISLYGRLALTKIERCWKNDVSSRKLS